MNFQCSYPIECIFANKSGNAIMCSHIPKNKATLLSTDFNSVNLIKCFNFEVSRDNQFVRVPSEESPIGVAFHDEDDIMAVSCFNNQLQVFSSITGDHLYSVSHKFDFNQISFISKDKVLSNSLPSSMPGDFLTYTIDLTAREILSSFFGTTGGFALHPVEDIIATIRNDQGGVSVRFVDLSNYSQRKQEQFGWGQPRKRVCDDEGEYGWYPDIINASGVKFSPDGNAITLIDGISSNWEIRIVSYHFPELKLMFDIEINRQTSMQSNFIGGNYFSYNNSSDLLFVPCEGGQISAIDTKSGKYAHKKKVSDSTVTCLESGSNESLIIGSSSGILSHMNVLA